LRLQNHTNITREFYSICHLHIMMRQNILDMLPKQSRSPQILAYFLFCVYRKAV